MPYFVPTSSFDVLYPDECPYCSISNSNSRFNQPFSKMEAGLIPGQFQSKTWKVMLPACDSCASIFNKFRLGYFLTGFSALVFPICIVVLSMFQYLKNLQFYATSILVLFVLTWATLLVLRLVKLRSFKVAYVGNDEVVFSSTNQKYVTEFASLNKAEIEEKRFLIKLA